MVASSQIGTEQWKIMICSEVVMQISGVEVFYGIFF